MTPTPTAAVAATVRAMVAAASPTELAEFDAELAAAGADAIMVLGRWAMRADPLTPEEKEQLERAKRGDYSGMLTRDGDGKWIRL